MSHLDTPPFDPSATGPQKTSGLAIASLVCSLICCIPITTILGMLPLVAPILFPQWFGPLEGRAATWAPIGLVIVGGLTTSTFLTLLIIPTLYSLIDDLSRFASRVAAAATTVETRSESKVTQ